MASGILILLIIIIASFFALRYVGINRIAYRRYFSLPGTFEGETLMLVEEIQNRFFLPLLRVDVDAYMYKELRLTSHVQMESGMQEFTSRFYLPPFTLVRRSIPVQCMKRGYYELDSVYIRGKSRTAKARLFVYPRALPFNESNPMENAMQSLLQSDRRLFVDPFSFSGVREYRPGDPFRSINYKATAKTGELKVNERDFFSSRSFMVYIDFQLPSYPKTISTQKYTQMMEKSLSYVADMVNKSISQGYSVGFAANCKKLLGRENHIRYPMRRGGEHYIEILQEMACIRISGGCSFLWLLQQDIDSLWNVDVYIVTANTYEDNYYNFEDIIAALKSKGNHVTILAPDTDSNGEDMA
ncbi:MAG: DUF58 domain-containing protein [Defluviitaleaceae bacterium]|nr:DUF58 domain-containing protein [Defluviitaleaceae bacterium]